MNAVNGVWNWGYDGVAWYAVHEPYGGPDGLKRFVDACHAPRPGRAARRRLQPPRRQRQLPARVRARTSRRGRNTWGDLVNLDGAGSAEVRRFIIDNALIWLRDFHLDGLRLDAVHALQDDLRAAPARRAGRRGRRAERASSAGRCR